MRTYSSRIFTYAGIAAICAIGFCPDLFALDGGAADLGGEVLKTTGDKIKTLVKPALGLGGIGGLVMGLMQAFKQSSIGPLMTWFGVGIGALTGYGVLGSDMFSAVIPF